MGQTHHIQRTFFWGVANFEPSPSESLEILSIPIVFNTFVLFLNRESIQGHGPTIAEPCLSYCGGGGGGGPN